MGVLTPVSAHARPSAQPPINTSGNILAHVFGFFFCGGGEFENVFNKFSNFYMGRRGTTSYKFLQVTYSFILSL